MKRWLKYLLILIISLMYNNLFSQVEWVKLNGPYGGRFYNIKFQNDSTIFVGTSNGVMKSTDYGKRWTKQFMLEFGGPDVFKIEVLGNKVFAITDSYIYQYDQTDQKFVRLILPFRVSKLKSYADSLYIIANDSSIYLSGDSLKTRKRYYRSQHYPTDLIKLNDSLLFVTCPQGVLISNDNGKNWRLDNLGYVKAGYLYNIANDSKNRIYVSEGPNLVITEDLGKTWSKVPLPVKGVGTLLITSKDEIYITGREGLFVSKDAGRTWENSNYRKNIWSFYLYKDSSQYLCTTKHLLRRENEFAQWTKFDYGISNSDLSDIEMKNERLYIIANGEFYYSADYGETWSTSENQEIIFSKIIFIDNDYRIFVKSLENYLYSTDNGLTWQVFNIPVPIKAITPIQVDNYNRIYLRTMKWAHFSDSILYVYSS